MGSPGGLIQTGRAGFVIHSDHRKSWYGCLNGCLGQWFFSQYCQCNQ